MTSSYEEKIQSIQHKKAAQHNRDYWTRCNQCGKIMGYHTSLEATACKKKPDSKVARVSLMTERQINEGEFSKV